MSHVITWDSPRTFRCDCCNKEAPGSLGYGYFGESITTAPPGWSRGFDRSGRGLLSVCSKECMDRVDEARTSASAGAAK